MKAVSDGETAMVSGTASSNPIDKRTRKIERYKKKRALSQRVAVRSWSGAVPRGSTGSPGAVVGLTHAYAGVGVGVGVGVVQQLARMKARFGTGGDDGMLEEHERELSISRINMAVMDSVDAIVSLNEEEAMLKMMAARRAEMGETEFNRVMGPAPPPKPDDPDRPGLVRRCAALWSHCGGCDCCRVEASLTFAAALVLVGGACPLSLQQLTHIAPTLEITRENFKATVFRPGHRLPTMSLAEYADREVEEAKARGAREK